MIEQTTIFHRTQSGRDEIQQKSHGLTQSERLVLIMVDGVSSYGQIRAKLPVLSDERFGRALQKLQAKELVLEVFMPVEGQQAEELERTVIDRFLQQDPMDPVTILFVDPDEEFGDLRTHIPKRGEPDAGANLPQEPVLTREAVLTADEFPVLETPPASMGHSGAVADPVTTSTPEPAVDEYHARLADTLAAELRGRKPTRSDQFAEIKPVAVVQPMAPSEPEPFLSPFKSVHWGYWMIVGGSSFILGFALARLTV